MLWWWSPGGSGEVSCRKSGGGEGEISCRYSREGEEPVLLGLLGGAGKQVGHSISSKGL